MPIIIIILILSISGCGGGGGGGGSSGGSLVQYASGIVDHDPYASTSLIASYKTAEYDHRYSLSNIRAAEAYALLDENSKPVAGDGTKIAISDTGVNTSHPEISTNYDSANSNNNSGGDLDGHGSNVASIAAGVKDGLSGDDNTHGVAFNAQIVSVKVIDSDGSAGEIGVKWLEDNDVSNVKVVNMSWAYTDFDGSFLSDVVGGSTYNWIKSSLATEFTAATNLDMVMTVAVGNDGSTTNVAMPALFAGDDVIAGKMIAVAAVDSTNTIADFSNHCSQVKNYCLVAPGVGILGAYTGTDYAIYSGTSQAAPHVAGAVAVLRAAWPLLSAATTVQILLDSAIDLGVVGVDDVYGHGLLNLEEAVHAQGANHVPASFSLDGAGYDARNTSIITSSIFGNAYAKNIAPALQNAVFFDKYGRDYKANLDQKISSIQNGNYSLDNILFNNYNSTGLPLRFGADYSNNLQIKFVARNFISDPFSGAITTNRYGLKYLTVDNSKTDPHQINSSDVTFFYSKNFNENLKVAFTKNDFNGDFSSDNPAQNFISYNNFSSSPYQKVSQLNFASNGYDRLSSNQLSISQNITSKLQSNFSFTNFNKSESIGKLSSNQSQIFDGGFNYQLNNKTIFGLNYGNFKEFDDRFLGSQSSGAFSFGSNSATRYIKFNFSRKLNNNWQLLANYSEGKTNISGNQIGIFRDFNNVRSRSMAVGILGNNILGGKFGMVYSEPLRVYKGTTNIDIPISRDLAGNVQRLTMDGISLKPDGKERDLEFSYSFNLRNDSNFSLNSIIQNQPGNIKSASQQYLWLARYNLKF